MSEQGTKLTAVGGGQEKKENILDCFLNGCRKGWDIGINSMLPNVVLAFTIMLVIQKTGLFDLIGRVCSPIMAIWGLPGEAITVLLAGWLAFASGVAVGLELLATGILTARDLTILAPAIFLMGAQLNYMGRCLGLSGLPSKYYKLCMLVCVCDALVSMWIMNLFV